MAAGKMIRVRRRRRRNTQARRLTTQSRKAIFNRGLGFPDEYRVKLRFNHRVELITGSSGLATFSMICNQIFDPLGSGLSYLGLDEYDDLYSRYVVHSNTVTTYMSTPTTTGEPALFVLYQNIDSTGLTDVDAVMAQPISKRVMVAEGDGSKIARVKGTRAQFLGRKFDKDHSAGVAGGPASTSRWYYHCTGFTLQKIVGASLYIDVLFTADVTFYKRKALVS